MLASFQDWDSNYPNGYAAWDNRRGYTQRLAKLVRKYSRFKGENSRVEGLRETLEYCLRYLAEYDEIDWQTQSICGLDDL